MWLVLLMYALFASTFTVGKLTLQSVDPFFLTAIRMFLAGVLLLGFQLTFQRKKLALPLKLIPLILILGIFNVFITNAFEYWGLQFMDTAKTSLIYSFSPFIAILFSYIFLSEKMNLKKWIGLAIGMIGFAIVLFEPGQANKGLTKTLSMGEIAVTISSFTSVIGWLIMKRLMTHYNYSFLSANTYSFFIASFLSLISSYFLETWKPTPVSSFTPFLLGMVYIAIIHNTICYNIYGWSLKRFSVSFMTFAGFSTPLFTALFGWLFLKESISPYFFLSLALIILGISIYSHAEMKLNPSKKI